MIPDLARIGAQLLLSFAEQKVLGANHIRAVAMIDLQDTALLLRDHRPAQRWRPPLPEDAASSV
jgi:hypothetical protein